VQWGHYCVLLEVACGNVLTKKVLICSINVALFAEEGVEVVMLSILARINCNGKNYQAKTVKNIF
jgi:hypothetical protein